MSDRLEEIRAALASAGLPNAPLATIPLEPDRCWIYRRHRKQAEPGRRTRRDYGIAQIEGRRIGAHRVAYQLFVGTIPKGWELDHLCRVPACINPLHLEVVSHSENLRRGLNRNREKTTCKYGHALTREPHWKQRRCRTCRKAASSRYWLRKQAGRQALGEEVKP